MAVVKCEFSTASFSAGERRVSKGNRQTTELGVLLGQTFESVILLEQFPRASIDIHVQVIQSDGGVLSVATNATTLALIDAGIPMRDFVVACAASFVEGVTLNDPNYIENSIGGPYMPLALMPTSNKVVLLQMDDTLHLDHFAELLEMAKKGCLAIFEILRTEVKEYAVQLVEARGGTRGGGGV